MYDGESRRGTDFDLLLNVLIECEERIPTRCNNIDDLLSIPDVDY